MHRTTTQLLEDVINGVPEIITGLGAMALGAYVGIKIFDVFLQEPHNPVPPLAPGTMAGMVSIPIMAIGGSMMGHGYSRICGEYRENALEPRSAL